MLDDYTVALDATLASRAEALDMQLLERTRALDAAFAERLAQFDDGMMRSTEAIDARREREGARAHARHGASCARRCPTRSASMPASSTSP